MGSHKDLKVWQEAMDLVVETYAKLNDFPKEELFGLTSQIKRSVVSIPSNIAEGAGGQSNAEYVRFLYIALGSTSEIETQIEIACRLGFINDSAAFDVKVRQIKEYVIGFNQKPKITRNEHVNYVNCMNLINFINFLNPKT